MNRILTTLLFSFTGIIVCNAQPYKNADLPAEQRAADLVSRLSLEQKVALMQNGSPAIPEFGIKAYDWWNEALHGVGRAGLATVFPQAIRRLRCPKSSTTASLYFRMLPGSP